MATLQSGKCFTVPTFFGMCLQVWMTGRMYIYKWHEVDQTKHEIFCVHIVCNEIQVKVNLEITTFFFYLHFPYCPNFFWFGVVLNMGRIHRKWSVFYYVKQFYLIFKAAVRKFCLFVAISVWKPAIAVICGIIIFTRVMHRHGSSADESNVLSYVLLCLFVYYVYSTFKNNSCWPKCFPIKQHKTE